ncbi:MAG: hypothetical protein Kow0029_19720 [Candidatus Rifleibacteriota bacterium]
MLEKIKELFSRLVEFIWKDKRPISKKMPIIFWFGAFFCFILFPVFLIDVGLDNFLNTRKQIQKEKIFQKLNNRLELLMQYGNSRHYYHAVLKRVFEFAEKSREPLKYLEKALPHLKKKNPGVFRFIVWDKKGKTVNSLSDEKSYKYIIRTLYEIFVKVSKDCIENYPGNPEQFEVIDKKINLMRSYLGAFFIPKRLNLPFLRGILGEVIMASSVPEKSHFWFRISDNFGLFANINISAIESNNYLKKLVSSLNKDPLTPIRCGIAELIKNNKVFTDKKLPDKEELLIELGKFGNTSESEVETPNQLMVIKPVTPFVLGFCTIPTRNILIDIASARKQILAATIFLISLVGCTIFFIIFKTGFFSIRWKLALLFIYANGLPLMILGFLGVEYLQQTRAQLLDQSQKQISELLTDFDTKYRGLLDKYGNLVNQTLDKTSKAINQSDSKLLDKELKKFENEILKLSPSEIFVVDNQGNFRIFKSFGKRVDKFIANLGRNLVDYVNYPDFTNYKLFDRESNGSGNIKAQNFFSESSILFDEILRKTRRIDAQQMGAEEKQYYWAFLGDSEKRDFKFLVMISWSNDTLQEACLKEYLEGYKHNSNNIEIYTMIETNGITHSTSEMSPEINKLFRQVFNLKALKSDLVRFNDKNYTVYGSVGKQMKDTAFIGAMPLDKIEKHLAGIRLRLFIFAALSLFMTTGIGFMLAKQFLEPVKELEMGVVAIGEQNFRYRIPITSADEFGHLGSVFNQAIESLEDLEIAKVVQENLFPLDSLKMNNLEVFGKSVSMTRLGGDYYDFFPIDDTHAGILMGDVAGHGVPAALLMAMAKASVLLSGAEEKQNPAAMLAYLHKVIHGVKSTKVKRMMTCQFFAVNTITGEFKFANAGHCFPALIKAGGKGFGHLNLVGTPLGITKKVRYKVDEVRFEDGDTLLLYTDGIIETKNREGVEMGFENFTSIVCKAYDENLETFYRNIFNAYLEWSPSAEDDITMVLIRYSQKNRGE